MIIESKLCAWVTAGLALYTSEPLMIESIFYDASQSGTPTMLSDGALVDTEKLWLPHEYAGGILRWGGATFPIVGNTVDTLTVVGDPSLVGPGAFPCYQVVHPAVASLAELLANEKFTVLSSFAQVPTQLPAVTLRLERDVQGDTYVGENVHRKVIAGVDVVIRDQSLIGTYIISVWATNREAVLWYYAWLMHYALASMPVFTSWGLYDVSFGGSDLDPSLQYLAERTYARHLAFTATRMERAMTVVPPGVLVEDLCVHAVAQYAQLAAALPMG